MLLMMVKRHKEETIPFQILQNTVIFFHISLAKLDSLPCNSTLCYVGKDLKFLKSFHLLKVNKL